MQTVTTHSDHQASIIQQTADFIKNRLQGEGSGHDWWHTHRVWQTAKHIAHCEHADVLIVELAALLHDVADWKFYDGDETVGPRVAREFLITLQVEDSIIQHVCTIIKNISFKGSNTTVRAMETLEGMIVQDADRLDAIGAVGIARTFAYGGFTHREIYNPDIPPMIHHTAEEYKKSVGPSINHFYEKLLLLKDRMNTATGKQLANKRHAFMELFLQQFFDEIPEKNTTIF